MRGLTRLLVVVITAITAMVLFSAAVFAAASASAPAVQHQPIAAQLIADETCPPVTHPHSTPVQRRCGQLAQTGQAMTLTTTGQPLGHGTGHDLLLFLAGLFLAGLGGGLIGLRFTARRR